MSRRWDRHAIKAEVHRRGRTLERLALDAGLRSDACRGALARRDSIEGELTIAAFIDVDPATLWPGRWREPLSEKRSNALSAFRASHSRETSDDARRSA